MHHTRDEVIERTIKEYELLDNLVAKLTEEQWDRLLLRSEEKVPWTVKDAIAHITHWKADVARSIRKQHRPIEERGLDTNSANHLIYLRWHSRSPGEVLSWHRQVQKDLLIALRDAPEEWFNRKDRGEHWPYDLDGHSAFHRKRDIERALKISR